MHTILLHHHEITLKGKNRKWFEKQLHKNLKKALKDFKGLKFEKGYGRTLITSAKSDELSKISEKLKKVFGIANFAICSEAKSTIGDMTREALEIAQMAKECKEKPSTFRVSASRADKNLPFTSVDIQRKVGGAIKNKLNLKVSLKKPDFTIYVEALKDKTLIYSQKVEGAGGLPVGIDGKVAALISSGFDSPIAALKMMKRGARVIFVHFHSYPQTSKASIDNVKQLVKILNEYQFDSKLYLIPFLETQKQMLKKCNSRYLVILYRRMMLRVAQKIAEEDSALGLVTGDSLGQVASQTLENMHVISEVAKLPIYRPLIGMDKEEIIDEARRAGTYEISSQPYGDCCSLFVPKNPVTKGRLEDVGKEEEKLEVDKIASEIFGDVDTFRC